MTISQFLHVLLARWKVIAILLGVSVAIAVALTYLLPSKYKATSTVVLDFKGTDPILGVLLPGQGGSGYLPTQLDIIHSKRTAIEAARILKLGDSPFVRQQFLDATGGLGGMEDWLGDLLLRNLDLKPSRDSSVVDITFEARDPKFAADVANAFAEAYQRVNLDLRVEPAKQTAAWFDEQLRQLRKNLEESQARLSAYQQKKGFTATDERLDIESARLGELSQQYTATQAAAADALSRQRQLDDFLARGASPETLPDVLANPVIQGLKTQLANSLSKFEQISSQLGANHPEIRRLKADIAEQRQQLSGEIHNVSSAIGNSARLAQRRQAELAQAVADQKARMLRVNQGRDEMAALLKEVESAQHAYEAAASRFTTTNLESQATSTTISLLNPATPPPFPSFPILWINVLVGIVSGLILGTGLALVSELIDRRVRSEEDLVLSLDAPLLGILDAGRARLKRGWGRSLLRRRPRIEPGLT
jgi:succinoglycan biosynthesis transport protein ExoP